MTVALSVSVSMLGLLEAGVRCRKQEVEWFFIYRVDDDVSQRHGPVESWLRMCDDGQVHGGGVVWRHG
jgi:hypothetical protein